MAPRLKEELVADAEYSNTKESDERSNDPSTGNRSTTWPETTGSPLQRVFKSWTFCYMKPLLQRGKQQISGGAHLTQEDLYDVPHTMKAKRLVTIFSESYNKENGRLLWVLWKLAAPTFVPAGFVQLVYMGARITLPLAMRELLVVLEEHPNESVVREGLPYVAIIFLAAVIAAFAQHRQVHLATKSGIIMRAALISKIYEHALQLSAKGKAGMTSGEVTNLVATDTQKLFEVMLEGHLVWSCPLFIVVVTSLLWVVMGPELLVGVVVLIAFVPIVQQIVQRMLKIRKKRAVLTDERISILTSMLQGIRVTKLNHYESKVLERVAETRAKEMKLLRSELFMWGWTLVSAVCSPLLATATSFSCYVLVNEDNIITPSSAFAVLLLFSILRFPINMGARLVGKLAQALDSARRISEFLERETQSDHLLDGTNCTHWDKPLIRTSNATFVAEGQKCLGEESGPDPTFKQNLQSNFRVRDISMKVQQSQVVAIVGRVGSGKTLLLQGLLGATDMEPKSKMKLKGTIGYAAQIPFILNATLRDNILFGLSYDKHHYQRVLAACQLEHDIQQFPGTDLCEIGERGVTLSGGQKARVSLARVLYANPDIALLDDVFSALDSGTAGAVFEALFNPEDGALRSQGTILVTHATKFLPRMHEIIVLSGGSPVFQGTWTDLQKSRGLKTECIDLSDSESCSADTNKEVLDEPLQGNVLDEKEELIMTTEAKESGLSSVKVWFIWFAYAGGWPFLFLQFLFLAFDRFMYVASEW